MPVNFRPRYLLLKRLRNLSPFEAMEQLAMPLLMISTGHLWVVDEDEDVSEIHCMALAFMKDLDVFLYD